MYIFINSNFFKNNNANLAGSFGGGIYIESTNLPSSSTTGSFSEISNNVFYADTASNGGGLYLFNGHKFKILNNTFESNVATSGGGIVYSNCEVTITDNNVFSNNMNLGSSTVPGADIKNIAPYVGFHASFKNNSLQLASTDYPANNISPYGIGPFATGNLFSVAPLFNNTTSIAGSDGYYFTTDDGLNLQSTSPLINSGNRTTGLYRDIRGNVRTTVGKFGCLTDIGAYEGAIPVITCTPTYGTINVSRITGQSFNYMGNVYTTTGTYSVTTQNVLCCDSIITINFVVLPTPTVTVNNNQIGDTATYTFSYVTPFDIGKGTKYPIIFMNNKNSSFQNYMAINPLVQSNLSIKVNNVSQALDLPIKFSSANSIQLQATNLANNNPTGLSIAAGSTIEISFTDVIKNPFSTGLKSIQWSIVDSQGSTLQNYSGSINYINCPKTYKTINQSICQGSSFTFNGIAQTTTGLYKDTLINAGGCDSILTLNLTVNDLPSLSNISATPTNICSGETTVLKASPKTSDIWVTNPVVYNYAGFVTAFDFLSFNKINISATTTIDALWLENVGMGATTIANLGLYSDNAGFPGAKIVQSTEQTNMPMGHLVFPITNTVLSPGNYWIGVNTNVGGLFTTTNYSLPSTIETKTYFQIYSSILPATISGPPFSTQPGEALGMGIRQKIATISSYAWTPALSVSNANVNTTNATPATTTIYTVTSTSDQGCISISTVAVTVNPTYNITATAAANGSISNAGISSICLGLNKNYVITPNAGFKISDVLVDGNSVGAVSSYNFTNVNSTHTIEVSFEATIILINAKAFLSGPYISSNTIMHDSLRVKGIIPTVEPYSSAPYNTAFTHVNGGGGEIASAGLFSTTGTNAIVDWVFVELRSAADASLVLATKSALIQRDGDIVSAADGSSPIELKGAAGNYYIAIKHRNHLPIMSANPIALSSVATNIDFTNTSTMLYTKTAPNNNPSPLTGAAKVIGSKATMYAGNCNIAGAYKSIVTYSNLASSDRTSLFGHTGATNTVNGYSIFDVDMNGFARFNGLNADRLVILNNCANSSSGLIVNEQVPN
jgi:hypothetical protein